MSNFGDYEGEYHTRTFKVLMTYFNITIEELSKRTGYKESLIEAHLNTKIVPKHIGSRMLTAMSLTNSDFSWVQMTFQEVEKDRTERVNIVEKIKSTQRLDKIEKETKKREEDKNGSSKEETKESKPTRKRRSSGRRDSNKDKAVSEKKKKKFKRRDNKD